MLRDIVRKLGLGMLAGIVAWVALAASSLGQTNAPVADSSQAGGAVAEPPIQFDVVSVRQSQAGRKGPRVRSMPADGDGMTFTNQPMLVMILAASDFNTIALTQGLPEWTMSDRYDMTAKVTGADVAIYHTLSLTQRLLMLRRALEDRIKLKEHLELRPEPVYDLTVAKSGPKMKAATPGETYPNEVKAGAGQTIFFTPPGRLVGQGATMAELASRMSDLGDYSIGHQVFDKTGLTGRYDFTLEWTPDMNGADASGGQAGDVGGPTLFTAVPEQLGLKLDAAKEPVECLIIDHAERPAAN